MRALFHLTLCVLLTSSIFATTYYVAESGDDSSSGLSWNESFKSIQRATENASENAVIWVKAGNYNLETEIIVPPTVSVYGGFKGDETELNQRSCRFRKTALNANRQNRVATNRGLLDGFSITGGYTENNGGGIYNDTNGTIKNCEVYDNIAQRKGGGIYNTPDSNIINCHIHNNTSQQDGDAVYNDGHIFNSKIYNNGTQQDLIPTASKYAVYMTQSNSTVDNCIIYNNNDSGIYNWGTVTNSTVYGNRFTGMHYVYTGRVYNSIIWGNLYGDIRYSGRVMTYGGVLANCCCSNPDDFISHGVDCITDDPRFINVEGEPSTWDFQLQADSPCIDMALSEQSPDTDYDGNPRLIGNKPDIGAYEYHSLHSNFETDKQSGLTPLTVTFQNLTQGNPISSQWDFNCDGIVDSSNRNPSYTFESAGRYTVILKTYDSTGTFDEIVKTEYIIVAPEETPQYDAAFSATSIPANLDKNTTSSYTVSFQNTGYQMWKKEYDIKLFVIEDPENISLATQYSLYSNIHYGDTADFKVFLKTQNTGSYSIKWQLKRNGVPFGEITESTFQVEEVNAINHSQWKQYK